MGICDYLRNLLLNEENEVHYINGSETLPSPLDKEMEDYYLEEFSKGSRYARNKLIEHNLRLVVYVARKYETSLTNLEDLISIGTIGLVKAIETFKNNKNIKLATYASRCIDNEILMYLRKRSRSKNEISLDEPLNVDYDGNELLLADILSSDDNDITNKIEEDEKKEIMLNAISTLSKKENKKCCQGYRANRTLTEKKYMLMFTKRQVQECPCAR